MPFCHHGEAMKGKALKLLLLSIALLTASPMCSDCVLAQPSGLDSKSSPTRRALLIGINKYKGVPQLRGSINDIETMRHILVTRWGFSEKQITMLRDEEATRAGILSALEQVVSTSRPQDIIYIHFSGHGSQVEDLNGDEEDGLDETIVPQDGRTGDIRDIVDDELDEIMSRLRARSVLIVLDSCHSGTATRSIDVRTRSVPQDMRIDLYRNVPVSRAVVPVVSSRFVVMTAAASHQDALDGPVDGRVHGFFTYALSHSISTSGPDASPRELFGGVAQELKRVQSQIGRSSMPEPQLEAPPDLLDKSILSPPAGPISSESAADTTRVPWLEVQPADSDSVVLVNGVLLGAVSGSTWRIYPPGESLFVPGQGLAIATVTGVRGKDALASIRPAKSKIPSRARAIAMLTAPVPPRVPIRILDVPQGRRKIIEETLRKQIKDVDIVESGQFARFLMDAKGNTLRLYSADGLQLVDSFSMDSEQWGANLALVVSRSANAGDILALANPSSQLKLDVRVAIAEPLVRHQRGIITVADTQPWRYRIRRPGEPRTAENSLQLEIRANADCYITVVDVDSQGGVNLLFPNNYQKNGFYPDGKIQTGKTVMLPDSIRSGNQAGFHWDYSPPQGTDTIRVFASTDLETATALRQRVQGVQSSSAQQTGSGVATRGAVVAGVGGLREDLTRIATRGLITVFDPTPAVPTTRPQPVAVQTGPDWTASSVIVLVQE